ncbi:CoA transferase subunit A [Caldibacillus thermolactis]|jgi:glutaconate CoA-transferase, subunit A|uniref:CoA transferase subunit A n=1 Tax=Pallidibacillus thermolactis TaxID=251051 RepID=A0ABT2WIL3_9BACI|nr:CoA-transferase [Pallidibacillus thermolactis]MCU9595518.1 CoA transferase subunit A [Pallidibacillus thermolactis]MCU9601793.1 CoA transferase subunit A [Pallidibacillus thermolactis subsp. kokeshiiformis]
MSKLSSIQDAVQSIENGALLALGGNALHRSPIAFVLELIRQEKKDLSLIKTAGALDVDLLALSKSIRSVYAGYIGFEMLGLAQNYRKGVQNGEITVYEHACASVIAALRASIYGVSFQPINGFDGSSLPELTGLIKWISCPFTNKKTAVVAALKPDVTIIHTNIADEKGNAYIDGSVYEDLIMVKAARRTIITTEKVISSTDWKEKPQIPGFLVERVVHAEKGAAPGSCAPLYTIDDHEVHSYLKNPKKYLERKVAVSHV